MLKTTWNLQRMHVIRYLKQWKNADTMSASNTSNQVMRLTIENSIENPKTNRLLVV
ncbi:hypothetical protein DOY81_006306 [Sarcophaga bullata]|nr:hypothetical protein DOY81_006306 [Sarcophaga bullata]